jgi:hypothetical protein
VLAVTSDPFFDGRLTFLDLGSGDRFGPFECPKGWHSLRIAFAPGGRTLASTGYRLMLWDLKSVLATRPR